MAIEKRFESEQNAWIISPSGYLDLFNLPQVEEAFKGTEGKDIVFCCRELRYMDSAVIKKLAEIAAQCHFEGHVFKMCALKSYLYKVIEMVGLQHLFVFEEQEEGQK